MSQDKLAALLQVSEGNINTEILFSINLPSHILAKYQNLRNSLLNSSEFSLPKFETCYSPRLSNSLKFSYLKFSKHCLVSMQHLHDKTVLLINSFNFPNLSSHSHLINKDFRDIGNNEDQVKDLTELTDEVKAFERKINENLETIKVGISGFLNKVTSDAGMRNQQSVPGSPVLGNDFGGRAGDEKIRLELMELKRENEELKRQFEIKIASARENWELELDSIKNTFEGNIKDLVEKHDKDIIILNKDNKQTLDACKRKFQNIIDKLKDEKNELNDKILVFTAKNSEESNFTEKIMNQLDELFERFMMKETRCVVSGMKEKIMMRLDSLTKYFESINQKSYHVKPNKKSFNLKEKLIENNIVLKEFEEARSKLMQHFLESPKNNKIKSNTTRF